MTEALSFPSWEEKYCGHRSGRFSEGLWGAGSLGGDRFGGWAMLSFRSCSFPGPIIFLCVWSQACCFQRRLALSG